METKTEFDSQLHQDLYIGLMSEMLKDSALYEEVEPTSETTGYEWLLYSVASLLLISFVYSGLWLLLNGASMSSTLELP